MIERQEAIERLCNLTAEVLEHIGYEGPSDCFCGKGGFWDLDCYGESEYRNDGRTIEFIEEAVREKINTDRK